MKIILYFAWFILSMKLQVWQTNARFNAAYTNTGTRAYLQLHQNNNTLRPTIEWLMTLIIFIYNQIWCFEVLAPNEFVFLLNFIEFISL